MPVGIRTHVAAVQIQKLLVQGRLLLGGGSYGGLSLS